MLEAIIEKFLMNVFSRPYMAVLLDATSSSCQYPMTYPLRRLPVLAPNVEIRWIRYEAIPYHLSDDI